LVELVKVGGKLKKEGNKERKMMKEVTKSTVRKRKQGI
jgi:hypothetical protein